MTHSLSRLRYVVASLALLTAGGSAAQEQARFFACVRGEGTFAKPATTPAEARARCGSSILPVTDAYLDLLPFVKADGAIVAWVEKGEKLEPPPDGAIMALQIDDKVYPAPISSESLVQEIRLTLKDFPASTLEFGDVVKAKLGSALWFVRWHTPTNMTVCVGEPVGPITDPVEIPKNPVTLASGMRSRRGCVDLTKDDVSPEQLRWAGLDDAVRFRLIRDGAPLPLTDPAYKKLKLSVVTPDRKDTVSGYEASDGAQEATLRAFETLPHNSSLSVSASFEQAETRYAFRLLHPRKLYGVQGFWIPLGLFGTTFAKSETGATLAAMPFGVAWGGRINVSDTFYLGGSLMGNYLIHKKVDANGAETSDYSLESVSGGLVVDVNNWVYVGGAYGKTFIKDVKDPGWMFVLGVAPGGLSIFKGR